MFKNFKRYSLSGVFWVVLGAYLVIILMVLVIFFYSPISNKAVAYERFSSLRNIADEVISVLFYSFYYYVILNLFYNCITGKENKYGYIRTVVLSFFLIGIHMIVSGLITEEMKVGIQINDKHVESEATTQLKIVGFVINFIFVTAFAYALAYITYLRDSRKREKILEEQKLQLEIEKSQANFNFLKAQINPHFLHNTLNFLYAKSLPYSEELSEGILTLSDIMRYALSEGNAKDGKAPLKDEIEHVRNVIKINQLRFSNNLRVDFQVEGVVNGAQIIPFVLITLVENAFKHGDLKSMEDPISIRLTVSANSLHFTSRNKKKSGPKELSTGIGLDNIRKRLDLAYGKNYSFRVIEDADFYTTDLTINTL
jgi:two-component system, LytTR family, sensor kinase